MNIFIFNKDTTLNAQQHCDKHVVKQLLEYTQLLCSAYYFTGESNDIDGVYKLTHKNHPCSIWVRESLSNWKYLYSLAMELYEEYIHRYGKLHKSGELALSLPTPNLKDSGLTNFVAVMPEQYVSKDIEQSYINYFNAEKQHIANWKERKVPKWYKK